MTTKERLERVFLTLEVIDVLRKQSPGIGRWLERACVEGELKKLEISTVIADVDERLDDIGRSEQDQA